MRTGLKQKETKGVDGSSPTVDQSHDVSRNPRRQIDEHY